MTSPLPSRSDAATQDTAPQKTSAESLRRSVLVLGAKGRLGGAAVAAFAAAGWHVIAQARSPLPTLPPGSEALKIDLGDTAGIVSAARGVGVVVYAVNPLYTRWKEEMLPLARQGMDIAARLGAVFMLPGNVYNFGTGMPSLLREDTPQRPDTDKGRLRMALEAELETQSAQGHRSIVIRAGDFFGSGSGNWFDQLITKSLAQGKLVYPGPLDVPHAWAYLPDLARAFVAAASVDTLPPFCNLHFAGYTLTGEQLLAAVERVARAEGRAPKGAFSRGGMPWRWVRVAGLFAPMLAELSKMSYLWRVSHALDGRLMRERLGPLQTTPLDLALARALFPEKAPASSDLLQPVAWTSTLKT